MTIISQMSDADINEESNAIRREFAMLKHQSAEWDRGPSTQAVVTEVAALQLRATLLVVELLSRLERGLT